MISSFVCVGNIGNLRKSSDYCRKTLQRQLDAGLDANTKSRHFQLYFAI